MLYPKAKAENDRANSELPDLSFVGIDSQTDLQRLPHACELAVYLSLDDRGSLYPSPQTISRIAKSLRGRRLAIHIRGYEARQQLLHNQLADLLFDFDRIYIDGIVSEKELRRVLLLYPNKYIITEHHQDNDCLRFISAANHQIVVTSTYCETSLQQVWKTPVVDKPVGYRIRGQHLNIQMMVSQIAKQAKGYWWLEVSEALRTDEDRFDPEFAKAVFEQFSNITAPDSALV